MHVQTLDTVIFETVYTLQSFYRETRIAIREALLPLINLTGIVLPGKQRYARAFEVYVTSARSFADSFHIAHAEQAGIREFISFDRDFDGLPNIRRIEP
jgi:predicted nucleic-acid-binding protein